MLFYSFTSIKIVGSQFEIERLDDDVILEKSSKLSEALDETDWDLFTYRFGQITVVINNSNKKYTVETFTGEPSFEITIRRDRNSSSIGTLYRGIIMSETIKEDVFNNTISFKVIERLHYILKEDREKKEQVSLNTETSYSEVLRRITNISGLSINLETSELINIDQVTGENTIAQTLETDVEIPANRRPFNFSIFNSLGEVSDGEMIRLLLIATFSVFLHDYSDNTIKI